MGDIVLGESKQRVQAEYGTRGHGFHFLQRWDGGLQGYYRLHGDRVVVTFENDHVRAVGFATRYYRTKRGFGIGSTIPLGPCHRTSTGRCEHRWRGFVFHERNKDSPCDCWIKVGDGAKSLPTNGSFERHWYFIYTHRGRATEFYFDRSFVD